MLEKIIGAGIGLLIMATPVQAQECSTGKAILLTDPVQTLKMIPDNYCQQQIDETTVYYPADCPISITGAGKHYLIMKNENDKSPCSSNLDKKIRFVDNHYLICFERCKPVFVTGPLGKPYYTDRTKAFFEK